MTVPTGPKLAPLLIGGVDANHGNNKDLLTQNIIIIFPVTRSLASDTKLYRLQIYGYFLI